MNPLQVSGSPSTAEMLAVVREQLQRIESQLRLLVTSHERGLEKEFYTVKELALRTGRAEFTVRAWCRTGRVRATRVRGPAGMLGAFKISRDEVARMEKEGLLPQTSIWAR